MGGMTRRLFSVVTAASLSCALFGFEMGSLEFVRACTEDEFSTSSFMRWLLKYGVLLGAIFGALFSRLSLQTFGHRMSIILSLSLHIAISIITFIVFEDTHIDAAGVALGKIFCSFSAVVAALAGGSFICETVTTETRGCWLCLALAMLFVGKLGGQVCGLILSVDNGYGWWHTVAVGCAFSFISLLISFLCVPPSPRWDIKNDTNVLKTVSDDTKQRLMQLRGASSVIDVETEIHDVISSYHSFDVGNTTESKLFQRPFILLCCLVILQQITGFISVQQHTITLLKIGIGNSPHKLAKGASLITAAQIFACLFSATLIDQVGRKKILLWANILLTVGLVGGCLCLHFLGDDAANIVTIIVLVLCTAFFQVGLGAVTWVLGFELFPNPVRVRGVALLAFVSFLLQLIFEEWHSKIEDKVGLVAAFSGYAAFALVATLFGHFVREFETKDVALDDMEKHLKDQ